MNISMKLVYQNAILINFSPTSNHLHALQVENCDSNSRLVVDEDDNGKYRLERVIADLSQLQVRFRILTQHNCITSIVAALCQ